MVPKQTKNYTGKRYSEKNYVYRKGDVFIIPTKFFAIQKNNFVKSANLSDKNNYKISEYKKHISEGKLNRPVVVLYNDEISEEIIVTYETTFTGKNNEKISWGNLINDSKNKKYVLHPIALKLKKTDIVIFNKSNPYKFYETKIVDDHIIWWKENYKKSYYFYLNYYLNPLKIENKLKKKYLNKNKRK